MGDQPGKITQATKELIAENLVATIEWVVSLGSGYPLDNGKRRTHTDFCLFTFITQCLLLGHTDVCSFITLEIDNIHLYLHV